MVLAVGENEPFTEKGKKIKVFVDKQCILIPE